MNRALRATTGNALCMHWCDAEDVPWGTDAIHQDTPAEIPRQLAFLGPPESSESRPSRNSPRRAARRRRQCPKARPRPGRSEAESIDDAYYGVSIIGAMVVQFDRSPDRGRVLQENYHRARTDSYRTDRHAPNLVNVHAGGAVLPARTGFADSDTRHDQRWRERPRQGALGSGAGHDSGVVHAIVGAVTPVRAPSGESAQSAASPS